MQAALQPTPRLIINALTYFNHYHVCFYSRASCQKTRYSVVPSSAEDDKEKLGLLGKRNIFKGNKVGFYSYRNWLTAGCSGFTQRFVKYLWSIVVLISRWNFIYICHCIRNCWFFRGKAVRKGKAYVVSSNKTLLWYGTLTLFPSKVYVWLSCWFHSSRPDWELSMNFLNNTTLMIL